MPQAEYENLFNLIGPPPGRFKSPVIDVNGAETVYLTLQIPPSPGPISNVSWLVYFGLTPGNVMIETASGEFDSSGVLAAPFPVFGPQMMVVVDTQGHNVGLISGNVYFVRLAP
jgi:hypothetical protein